MGLLGCCFFLGCKKKKEIVRFVKFQCPGSADLSRPSKNNQQRALLPLYMTHNCWDVMQHIQITLQITQMEKGGILPLGLNILVKTVDPKTFSYSFTGHKKGPSFVRLGPGPPYL